MYNVIGSCGHCYLIGEKGGEMKKTIFVVVMCLVFASTAIASEINGLVGAAMGYISSYSNVAIAFNSKAGQSLYLSGLPMQYSSTAVFCGLGRYGATDLIISGYSTWPKLLAVTTPTDDFYMFLCIKSSGISGDFAPIVLDSSFFTSSNIQSSKQSQVPEEISEDSEGNAEKFIRIVEEAINQNFGR